MTHASPMPTRILHVATRYLRGGSERRIRDIVRAIPEATHELVVGADSDPSLAAIELGPATVSVLPTLVRPPDPWRDAVTLARLIRTIGSGGFDLMVTHQSKAGVLGRTAARICAIPVVHSLSMASFGPGYPRWQSAMFRSLEAWLAPATAGFAAVGADLCRMYADIGAPLGRLHVVRSGVRLPGPSRPTMPRNETRRRLGLPERRPVIAYVGSLEARKNVLDLPGYLGRIASQTPDPHPFLAIAGQGPLADRLRAEAVAAGLKDDLRLAGFVADPLPLIEVSDLVVLLSSVEGLPQVLVQAAALGTPFVAYDVPGVRELLELGADGVAVPVGDVTRAATASVELLHATRSRPEGTIDLSAWSPQAIADGHRRVISSAMGSIAGRHDEDVSEDRRDVGRVVVR